MLAWDFVYRYIYIYIMQYNASCFELAFANDKWFDVVSFSKNDTLRVVALHTHMKNYVCNASFMLPA